MARTPVTVMVTGATTGLGRALAGRLLRDTPHRLVLTARASSLPRFAEAGIVESERVALVPLDVTRPAQRRAAVAAAEARFGAVDVLVNNAGVESTRRLVDQSESEVRAQIEINLIAPIELTRAIVPGMIARGRGVVVNVSSMSGKSATPFNSVYAATKHGLNGFSSSLGVELHGSGVHVGVVCPSFVSEAGMWADGGLRAPAALPEVSPEAVVRGVLKVIRGHVEVLVTPGPIRPLLALRQLVPSLEGPMLRAMGVAKVFGKRADERRG